MTQKVFAPYNFVPLSEHVFEPEWGKLVCHDLPFKDGICGSFTIEIENETPLIPGGLRRERPGVPGKESKKGENGYVVENWRLGDRDAIPGSSLKGMVRTVLEIAAFARILPRMDDTRYSLRDLLEKRDYVDQLTEDYGPKSKAGWLTFDREKHQWKVLECNFSHVRHKDLNAYYEKSFRQRAPEMWRRQTAKQKYYSWRLDRLDLYFTPGPVSREGDWAVGRKISRASDLDPATGKTKGRLIFTGQPQDGFDPRSRQWRRGAKASEFIFYDKPAAKEFEVDSVLLKEFELIHGDPNTGKPNEEWGYWRPLLFKGERVPVFWLPPETPVENRPIRAMGLAMMFRLANRHTTHDMVDKACPNHGLKDRRVKPDLAELLFGGLRLAMGGGDDGKKLESLKGRVQISAAVAQGTPKRLEAKELCLLSPKPSFFPAYVEQAEATPGTDGCLSVLGERGRRFYTNYMTLETSEGKPPRLRGWKRYPVSTKVRSSNFPRLKPGDPDNKAIRTEVCALEVGTRFQARVAVHNLKPEELGAVVWALTWGGQTEFRHALGMGRPLGYGMVRVTISPNDQDLEWNDPNKTQTDILNVCLKAFQSAMELWAKKNKIPGGWAQSEQIRSLLAMANPGVGDALAAKGELNTMAEPRFFQEAKRSGSVLLPIVPASLPKPSTTSESPFAEAFRLARSRR